MSTAKWSHSLFLKCPTCGKGDLYTSKSSFDLKNFLNMHQKCTVCSEDFVVETGFYQGAMYISYILSCALCLSILPIYYLFNISWEKFLDNANDKIKKQLNYTFIPMEKSIEKIAKQLKNE